MQTCRTHWTSSTPRSIARPSSALVGPGSHWHRFGPQVVSADENALIAPTFKPMASSAPQQLIMCSATKQSLEVSQLLSSGGNICVPCQQLNVIVATPA